jgi:hypothetical protein
VIPEVEGLAADEQGLVLGLLSAGAPQALDWFAGPGAARCRAALDAVTALGRGAMAAERKELADEIGAPLPAGLALVHPGWLRRVLEGEPSHIVRAVAQGAPEGVARVADDLLAFRDEPPRRPLEGPRVADLQRAVFAPIAPMPRAGGGPPVARALCFLPFSALLEEIDRRGATTIGLAVAGAPDAVVARAAAGAGPAFASIVLAAAKSGPAPEVRAEARSVVSADRVRMTIAHGAVRATGLCAVARAVAPEGEAALAAVAQSLPPALGDALLACAHAEAA